VFYIKPKRAYCRKHGIEYSGYMCPECRMELERAAKNKQSKKKVDHNTNPPKSKKYDDFMTLEETNKAANKATERLKGSEPPVLREIPKPSKSSISLFRTPSWLFALLLIFALSILGLGLSAFTKSPIPFWLLFGFSIIYPIEKWFRKTITNKPLGKFYRLVLNLVLLSSLGFLIWSGFQLVAKQLASTPLMSSVVFFAELVFFIWIWRKVTKNRWRFPSMKLTVFLLVCIALVFTFAGVPPLSTYKDNLVIKWEEYQTEQATQQAEREAEIAVEQQRQQFEQEAKEATRIEEERVAQVQAEQARKETEAEVARIASLRNPSWDELKAFLLKDDTDKMKYVYPIVVCADFADKLKRNAEEAGWRCAVVSMTVTGYDDPFNYGISSNTGHACNAFETTDRGLVYIDCTGSSNNIGPVHQDRIAKLEIGKRQINQFIFPTDWICVDNISIIRSIDIRW